MTIPWDLIARVFVAAVLGGVIGAERQFRSKQAGLRTHFIIALGSALFTVISIYGFKDIMAQNPNYSFDPSRIAAQIVTGIGFLGAGIIIFQKNSIHGLTTAAGIWTTSAIGIGCGCGMYSLAIAGTLLTLVGFELLGYIDGTFRNARKNAGEE